MFSYSVFFYVLPYFLVICKRKIKNMPFIWRAPNVTWHTDLSTRNSYHFISLSVWEKTRLNFHVKTPNRIRREAYIFIWHFVILTSSILNSYLFTKMFIFNVNSLIYIGSSFTWRYAEISTRTFCYSNFASSGIKISPTHKRSNLFYKLSLHNFFKSKNVKEKFSFFTLET